MEDLSKIMKQAAERRALLPCPFCGGTDLVRTRQFKDYYDIENASKRTLTMTLVHCNKCFASALEEIWNERAADDNEVVTHVVERDLTQ